MNKAIVTLVAVVLGVAVCSAAVGKDWSDHMGKIKFRVGSKKGFKKADGQKKPMMLFFTTTW